MARQATLELVGDASKLVKSLKDAGTHTDTFGDKIKQGGKQMTAFATVPIIGFLGLATKAAAEDAAAQDHLAKTLENTVGASKATVAQVEAYVTSAMKASTFTDDELRPSFETLVRSTNDVAKANALMAVAMDVAAGKSIPLETATLAVTKASEGNFAAVNKLVPGLLDLKDKTLTAESATKKLAELFGGQASAATETAAGKAKMMTRDMGELTEQLGTALLPVLSAVLGAIRPVIDAFANMSAGTQKAIVFIGLAVAAIGPLITVVTSLGAAMTFLSANPIVLAIAGFVAMAAATYVLYQRNEDFRQGVNATIDSLGRLFGAMQRVASIPGNILGGAGKLLGFASGGIVPGAIGVPQLAVVHGGETVTPYGRGGGGDGTMVVNLYVSSFDPAAAGPLVVRALDEYESRNGARYART
jgi:hypothetical protein